MKFSIDTMKLMKNIIKNLSFLIIGGMVSILGSCSNDPSDSPFVGPEEPGEAESSILIYAVATNNLASNLISDKSEMLRGAQNIDLNKNNILIFETKNLYLQNNVRTCQISLIKLVKGDSGYNWETIEEYSSDIDPLDPLTVKNTINNFIDKFPAKSYGLVFWSHSTGADPYMPVSRSEAMSYSFGQDQTASLEANEQINVDELASAIPNDLFHYIWFDSCYMSNIESIYEFRKKCNYYVGYPTEVDGYGLPYDIVLPYMVGEDPDLVHAAELFYNHYKNSIATVAVMDMAKIENFANACSSYLSEGYEVSNSSMMKYSRGTIGPFYDLGDYVKAMAKESAKNLPDNVWNEILDDFVIYKAATPRDYNNALIYPERYSGISTHKYTFGNDSSNESFYKSLSWFSTVF